MMGPMVQIVSQVERLRSKPPVHRVPVDQPFAERSDQKSRHQTATDGSDKAEGGERSIGNLPGGPENESAHE
jgi:hypothetical protein